MGFFVEGDGFDLEGPEWANDPERPFYTVGRLEQSPRVNLLWVADHTLTTDSYGVALLWALALVGVVDDGENPKPLARVVAHRTDPSEAKPAEDDLVEEDEERTIAFVTPEAVISAEDPEGKELAAETRELPELIKAISVEEDED